VSDSNVAVAEPQWINYPHAQEVLRELERLLTISERPRMPGRLLIGEISQGKTWLVEHFVNKYKRHEAADGNSIVIPVLLAEAPPEPNEKRLYENILDAMGAAIPPRSTVGELYRQLRHQIKKLGVRMLIIDEIHNQLAGPTNKQRIQATVIKTLVNQLRIPIVLVGTPLAYNALLIDDQLSTRFPAIELPKWQFDDDFRRLLLSLKLLLEIQFDGEELGPKILTKSKGTMGRICVLLESAGRYAKENGRSSLKMTDLDRCDYRVRDS
jgi:hypothetical protein